MAISTLDHTFVPSERMVAGNGGVAPIADQIGGAGVAGNGGGNGKRKRAKRLGGGFKAGGGVANGTGRPRRVQRFAFGGSDASWVKKLFELGSKKALAAAQAAAGRKRKRR